MFDSTMVRRLPAVAVLAATAMLAGGLQAQTQFFVPPNLPAGSQYQLVFVTAGQTTGSYTLEDGYNSFVTGQAAPLTAILPAGTTWDAVTSTLGDGIAAGVNAPTYANIPIYNTGGQLVAANGYGFWSNTHQNAIDFDQYGQAIGYYVWTGTDWNGQPMPGATLGTTVPECGWSGDTDGTWTAYWAYFSSSDGFSFYGLSSVITVPPFSIAWTSTGGGSWSNASNWGGNVVPGGYPGTAAVFGTVIGSGTATVTLDGNWTPGALTFSTTGGGSYIITLAPGDTHFLTLTGTGTSVPLVSSGGNHTIAVPLWLEQSGRRRRPRQHLDRFGPHLRGWGQPGAHRRRRVRSFGQLHQRLLRHGEHRRWTSRSVDDAVECCCCPPPLLFFFFFFFFFFDWLARRRPYG